jgi:hypothetical protein
VLLSYIQQQLPQKIAEVVSSLILVVKSRNDLRNNLDPPLRHHPSETCNEFIGDPPILAVLKHQCHQFEAILQEILMGASSKLQRFEECFECEKSIFGLCFRPTVLHDLRVHNPE